MTRSLRVPARVCAQRLSFAPGKNAHASDGIGSGPEGGLRPEVSPPFQRPHALLRRA